MITSPRTPAVGDRATAPVTEPEAATRRGAIPRSNGLIWLATLIALLAVVAAGAGLFWQGGDGPTSYTSVQGETVELYGEGLYRYDSVFKAGANKGSDAVTLALGLPLLAIATTLCWRGSLHGHLLLIGTLAWFLYAYASQALATAYNGLFLVYVPLVSASLFAFVLAVASVDLPWLASRFSRRMPRRSAGVFMIVSGLVTLLVWIEQPTSALLQSRPPEGLDGSTTLVTHVLDIGIIVPAALLSGLLILRRAPLGYLIALSMLVLEAMLLPMIAAQTAFQVEAGVTFTAGQIVGIIGGFSAIAAGAIWFIVALLRNIADSPAPRTG